MSRYVAPLIAAALLALTACSSSNDDQPDPIDTALSEDILASVGPSASIPPTPTGAHAAAYLSAVRSIDPELADTEMYSDGSLILGGLDACQAVALKTPAQAQTEVVTTRLTTADWTATPEQADRLIAAARKDICPTY
ncbi:hypothetical protein ACFZAM_02945 [Streptomyces sp. NPDC008079]|uniref:hypothetical protein n=1 Tax=Streptomyces sp. NPDC008079 TaxID=3364806 RepID=UPI0036EB69D6